MHYPFKTVCTNKIA